jgi:putative pyruvate formate lyase activating enzyme
MTRRFIDQLAHCECCPRKCGVNRLEGRTGFCRIAAEARISYAGLHSGEEPPISGTHGSGTIFFAGCNLRCVFCQNYQISQEFQASEMKTLTTDALADEMLRLQKKGAHNINLVSPSHVVFQAADAIVAARARGLTIPIVYNSNGYDSVDALRQIRGLVEIYLPDIKYLSNDLAWQYSGANDYAEIIPGVLREMLDQVGLLELDDDGVARRGLLVRHLVLPGAVDNSRQCLAFLAQLSPAIHVSIMSQYSPQYRAAGYAEINRPLTVREYDEVTDYAVELGLENAFIQELDSRHRYLPDFDRDHPFE